MTTIDFGDGQKDLTLEELLPVAISLGKKGFAEWRRISAEIAARGDAAIQNNRVTLEIWAKLLAEDLPQCSAKPREAQECSESAMIAAQKEAVKQFKELCRQNSEGRFCNPVSTSAAPPKRADVRPWQTLQPVCSTDLRLGETCLHGVLMLRVEGDPCLVRAVGLLARDCSKRLVRIFLYNVSPADCTFDQLRHQFPQNACLAIRQPYYKTCADGWPGVRVDSATDVKQLTEAEWSAFVHGEGALPTPDDYQMAALQEARTGVPKRPAMALAALHDATDSCIDSQVTRIWALIGVHQFDKAVTLVEKLVGQSVGGVKGEDNEKLEPPSAARTAKLLKGKARKTKQSQTYAPVKLPDLVSLKRMAAESSGNVDLARLATLSLRHSRLDEFGDFVHIDLKVQQVGQEFGVFAEQAIPKGTLLAATKAMAVVLDNECPVHRQSDPEAALGPAMLALADHLSSLSASTPLVAAQMMGLQTSRLIPGLHVLIDPLQLDSDNSALPGILRSYRNGFWMVEVSGKLDRVSEERIHRLCRPQDVQVCLRASCMTAEAEATLEAPAAADIQQLVKCFAEPFGPRSQQLLHDADKGSASSGAGIWACAGVVRHAWLPNVVVEVYADIMTVRALQDIPVATELKRAFPEWCFDQANLQHQCTRRGLYQAAVAAALRSLKSQPEAFITTPSYATALLALLRDAAAAGVPCDQLSEEVHRVAADLYAGDGASVVDIWQQSLGGTQLYKAPAKQGASLAECARLKELGNEALAQDVDKAVRLYSDALRVLEELGSPDDAAALSVALLCNRSLAELRRKQPAAALADADQAIATDSRCVKAYYRRAEACRCIGLRKKALTAFQDALGLETDASEIQTIRCRLRSVTEMAQEVAACPDTLAALLRSVRPGSTLLLSKGTYTGPFVIERDMNLLADSSAGSDGVILQSTFNSTVTVRATGRVLLANMKIVQTASPTPSACHAVLVQLGSATISGCSLTSTGGATVGVSGDLSDLVLFDCELSGSTRRGLIVEGGARSKLFKVRVTGNAAGGIEVRTGSHVEIRSSRIWQNGDRQGILAWSEAAKVSVFDSEISGHRSEAGILCDAGVVELRTCRIFNNGIAGVAVESGLASIKRCIIYGNGGSGVLLQAAASAKIGDNDVYDNKMHGVFIGYDAVGASHISENRLFRNQGDGIFNGAPRSDKVRIGQNIQKSNRGMPSTFHHGGHTSKNDLEQNSPDKTEWLKRVQKLGGAASIEAAHPSSPFVQEVATDIASTRQCWQCQKAGEPGVTKLYVCQSCKVALYCSSTCQKEGWKKHKDTCKKHIDRPVFGQPGVDLNDLGKDPGQWVTLPFDKEVAEIEYGSSLGNPKSIVEKARRLLEVQDYAAAFNILSSLGDSAILEAQLLLGQLYDKGQGCQKDGCKARDCFSRAASKGSAAGMALLGNLYRTGSAGLKADMGHAKEWWAKAKRSDKHIGQKINLAPSLDELKKDARAMGFQDVDSSCMEEIMAGFKASLLATPNEGSPIDTSALSRYIDHHEKLHNKPRSGNFCVNERQLLEKLQQAVNMKSAVAEDTVDDNGECAQYLAALQSASNFLDCYDCGRLEEGLVHLVDAYTLDEKAVTLQIHVAAAVSALASTMEKSPVQALRLRGLWLLGLAAGPLDAVRYFSALINEGPPTARHYELQASAHAFCQKWKEAILFSKRALDVDPAFYHAHFCIAVAHKYRKEYSEAVVHGKLFLQLCPGDARKSVDAHYVIAYCFLQQHMAGLDRAEEIRRYFATGQRKEAELKKFWGENNSTADKMALEMLDMQQLKKLLGVGRKSQRALRR
ncbi:unnamed protein product [Polarella glacialis]|uniref:MYND-type domain-containing protein n=1 Tax=Polarella glacialis TaxID=89957 RepID=A0A813EDA7_POLGL|nr:unnamed protein product [Polarella glacialis]